MSNEAESTVTLREIRRAGARAFFSRRWFGRALFATAVLYAVQGAVAGFFVWARQRIGFSSWNDFLSRKAEMLASGLDYAIPSRAVALNMTYASAFETFVTLVFAGVFTYGLTVFALNMVRGEDGHGYFAGALGGFARPLGVAWLLFRIQIQIFLWSLLFLVPGVVAWYRYRAAWYLKAENPDWSAGKCLAESGRLMAGHKRRCFALDCSYWLVITGVLVLGAVAMAVLAVGGTGAASWISALAIFGAACLAWCVHAGQTVFYLSIVGRQECRPDGTDTRETTER